MKINLNSSAVPVRENRLGSITGYDGDLQDLVEKSRDGSLQNCERCFSQSSSCLSICGLGQLSGIRDVAIVYHAPPGCCATFSGAKILFNQIAALIGERNETVVVGSDLNESDTVFGSINALRDIARKTIEEFRPKAIFIASSCVTGVIGEDIDALVDELRDEINIPIAAVHCEGFKSRIWASGFDIADHAVLQAIVKPPKEKRPVINFKNFFESARPEITRIFAELGVTPQFLYANATVEELSHISESLATTCVCGTLGTYLGNALEEKYGVPYIRTINQLGITGFETWPREIGRVIGKIDEVEAHIAREREIYIPQIETVKSKIKGIRAIIGMGPGYTYEVARVCQELGIEVDWAAAWHYDYQYDNGTVPPALEHLLSTTEHNIKLSVADQQNFEILNILNERKPDIYFSRHPGSTVWAIKQGVPALFVADEYMIFGYKGTLNFAKAVYDTITNRSFSDNLKKHSQVPYTDWWYAQNHKAMLKGGNL